MGAETSMSTISGDFPLDEAVILKLPPGTQVLSANTYGYSSATTTACITTVLPNGTPKRYFLKCAPGTHGRGLLEGEYTSMHALFSISPTFVPQPHAWGQFLQSPDTYFLLMDFIPMAHILPLASDFCAQLIHLHKTSVSPTSQFGFPITTFHGDLPQALAWDSSWERFFHALLARSLEQDRVRNGVWRELQSMACILLTYVLPRLLGPLESEGRSIKPSLIHGDLWPGNIGTCTETGNVYIFDAGAYYAHHEMELGMWRCERHEEFIGKGFVEEYVKRMGISEPVHMFDDRNRLYAIKMNIVHSAHHERCRERRIAYEDICYLVEKYALEMLPENKQDEGASLKL